jgi:hypothetical protein
VGLRLSVESVLGRLADCEIPVPGFMEHFLPGPDRVTDRWLSGRDMDRMDVMRACWIVLLVMLCASTVIAVIVVFLPSIGFELMLPALILAPVIGTSLMANSPKRLAHIEMRAVTAQGPRMVACMTMNMQSRPNLERAVSATSELDDGALARMLRGLRWRVVTRMDSDMVSALMGFNSDLEGQNQGLRQSFHLVISANYERTRMGLERLLDKANQVVLESTRELVDRYASSLSVPTMVLFSIGIILPVMLFALLPLASMGDILSASCGMGGLGESWLTLLFLVVFPGSCLAYSSSILSRNPLRSMHQLEVPLTLGFVIALLIWGFSVFLSSQLLTGMIGSFALLTTLIGPPSILILCRCRGRNRARREVESEFANALYQMGNRMVTGASLEMALEETALSMKDSIFSNYARRVRHLARVTREGLPSLMSRTSIAGTDSPLLVTAMEAVAEEAQRDCRAAGKVALNLAQNIGDLRKAEARMEERLRGVVDMMRSIALVFAPLVLGITSSLFGLIGMQTGQPLGPMDTITLLVGIYLIELALIVSYFTTFLMGKGGWREVLVEFVSRAPLAVMIFAMTSLMSMNGMMALL